MTISGSDSDNSSQKGWRLARILWKFITRIRKLLWLCRALVGLGNFDGDEVYLGDPIGLSNEQTLLTVESIHEGVVGGSFVFSRMLYEFSVAIDVATDSAMVVSNRVVEKFGSPHVQHIQLVFGVMQLYAARGKLMHLMWNQVSQLSQATAHWLDLQGLPQSPHGYLYTGPGLWWQSPASSIRNFAMSEFFCIFYKNDQKCNAEQRAWQEVSVLHGFKLQ
ncbi:hypothetical protein ACF0H5_005996 [Mactra antiquata]